MFGPNARAGPEVEAFLLLLLLLDEDTEDRSFLEIVDGKCWKVALGLALLLFCCCSELLDDENRAGNRLVETGAFEVPSIDLIKEV